MISFEKYNPLLSTSSAPRITLDCKAWCSRYPARLLKEHFEPLRYMTQTLQRLWEKLLGTVQERYSISESISSFELRKVEKRC